MQWQTACDFQICKFLGSALRSLDLNLRSAQRLLVVTAALVFAGTSSWASVSVPLRSTIRSSRLSFRAESSQWKQLARFTPVKNGGRSCAAFTPPQAISERAPLGLEDDTKARLNFVVTRNGEVSGVVVLHLSAGDERDLIGAVMGWRFRPATCDGVATESEADLELQSRK